MAGKSATLAIRIVSDASSASKGFDDAEARVGGFQRGLDKASVAAAGVLAGVGALAKGAFDAASGLQQSTGAIESVFGDNAKLIKAVSDDAAGSVGLSTAAYNEQAAALGASLKNMGVEAGKLAPTTSRMIQWGADLAATYGGTTADAVGALGSALRGETDPIERYGINIKQATIDAYLAANGMDKLTGAAETQARTQATLALIQQQAGGALGGFAREADTAAGAQQRATAEWENAQATLGEVLLPIVADGATKFAELTGKLVEHKDTVIPIVAVIAGLAATVLTVNAAVSAYRAVAGVATAAQWLFNAAMAANPLVLVAVLVAAVVAAVVIAYQKFDGFRNVVDTVGRALKSAFEGAKKGIQWVLDKMGAVGKGISAVTGLFSAPSAAAAGGGAVSGLYGAADGASVPGLYGAASSATAGGGSTARRGPAIQAGNTYQITVTGALDPQAVARQLRTMLKDLDVSTGRTVAVAL